ncbi:hypothetical protein Cpir12675_000761 [Ceratocystis pirilliformis]|uniref:Uncharacterized protein n=1 Tax=Ceratocystis pirilliformis TaxID=259994 RepID=A0ABR3ZLN2_9PEZI
MTPMALSGATSDDPDAFTILYTSPSPSQLETPLSSVPVTDRPWFVATVVLSAVAVLCAVVSLSFMLYRRRRRHQPPLSVLSPGPPPIPPHRQLPLPVPLPHPIAPIVYHTSHEKPVLTSAPTCPSAVFLKRSSTQSFAAIGDHRASSHYNPRDSGSHSYSHSQRHSRSRNLSRNLSRTLSRNLSRTRAMTPEQLILEQENQRQLALRMARQEATAQCTASSSISALPAAAVPPYTPSQFSARDSSIPESESIMYSVSMPPPIHENDDATVQSSPPPAFSSAEPGRFMCEQEIAPHLRDEWGSCKPSHAWYIKQHNQHACQEQLHNFQQQAWPQDEHLYRRQFQRQNQQQNIMQQVYIAEDEVYSTDSDDDSRSISSQISLRSEWKAFEAAAQRNQSGVHPVIKNDSESSSPNPKSNHRPEPLLNTSASAALLSFTMETPLPSPSAFEHSNHCQSLIPPPLLPRRSSRRRRTRSMDATGYEHTVPRRSNGTPVLTLTVPAPVVLRKAVSTSEFLKHHRQASSMASSHLEYGWPALDFDWLPFQKKDNHQHTEEEDEEVASLSCISPLTTIPPKNQIAIARPPSRSSSYSDGFSDSYSSDSSSDSINSPSNNLSNSSSNHNLPSPSSAPSSAVTAPEPRSRWSDEIMSNRLDLPIDRSQSMDTSSYQAYRAKRAAQAKRLPPGGWQLQISTLDITGACPRPSIVAEDEVVESFPVSPAPLQHSPVSNQLFQAQSAVTTSHRSSRRSILRSATSQTLSDSSSPTQTPSMKPVAKEHHEEVANRRRQSSTLTSSYGVSAPQRWHSSNDSELICSSRLDGPLGDLMPGF